MADKKEDIRVVSWPDKAVPVQHRFRLEEPVPVGIGFEKDSEANVVLRNAPRQALDVNMNLNLNSLKMIPVCLSVCEPICIKSGYRISISIFERPVVSITIKGQTVISSCDLGV